MHKALKNNRIFWLYPKLDKWMGGTRFVFEVAKLLSEKYNITIICQKATSIITNEFHDNGVFVYNLNTYSYTDLNFWILFNRNVKKDINQIKKHIQCNDLLISSMYPMNYIASHFQNYHVQIIYEPFSFFYNNKIGKDYNILINLLFKFLSLRLKHTDVESVKKAHVVLTLSEFEKVNIQNIYNTPSEIIYEGVNTGFFYKRNTKDLSEKYSGFIPLMHSTGFDSYKGTDFLLSALPILKRTIPNFKLFITYTRENKAKLKMYKSFIRKYKLNENIEFLSFIPYNQLPYFYSFAKIYLEPGVGRSMSLSNKEAMACGTPVIRGNDSDEEVIDGYNGFLVSPHSTSELVLAIEKICFNDSLYKQMSDNAIKIVREKFSWSSVTHKIINKLEENYD